jgi:hypothetical protein
LFQQRPINHSARATKHQIQDVGQWNFNVRICTLPLSAAGVATDARIQFPTNECLETNRLEISEEDTITFLRLQASKHSSI